MTHPITINTRRAEGATGPVLIGFRWCDETDGRAPSRSKPTWCPVPAKP